MTEQDRRPPSDLVSFGPTVTDTRGFTVGLWATEILLFALILAGFTVLQPLGDSVRVLTACGAMAWLASVTAIVLRGRLQPVPGILRRVVGVVAVIGFAAWLTVVLALARQGGLRLEVVVLLDAVGVVLQTAALVAAYFARMFRWGRA